MNELENVIAQLKEYYGPSIYELEENEIPSALKEEFDTKPKGVLLPEKAYDLFDVDGLLEFGHTEEDIKDLVKAQEMVDGGEITHYEELFDLDGRRAGACGL